MNKRRVLILCTDVQSAGTNPSSIRPEAIAAMHEIGIDISGQRSKHVDEFRDQKFDIVLTVCDNAKETCPIYIGAGAERLHHSFEDPAAVQGSGEVRHAAFRLARDQIRRYLAGLSRPS